MRFNLNELVVFGNLVMYDSNEISDESNSSDSFRISDAILPKYLLNCSEILSGSVGSVPLTCNR